MSVAVFRRPCLPEDEGRYHFEGMYRSDEAAMAAIEALSSGSGAYFKPSDYVLFDERLRPTPETAQRKDRE